MPNKATASQYQRDCRKRESVVTSLAVSRIALRRVHRCPLRPSLPVLKGPMRDPDSECAAQTTHEGQRVVPVRREWMPVLCVTDDSRHTRARRGRVPMGLVSMTMNLKVLEWFGVITAIAYSLFVASNIGLEFLGFVLLFISALSIGAWAYLGGHRGILLLQFFYAVAGLIGMVRWF